MNFKEDIVLENDQILLRPLKASDFENLLPFSNNEPELWTYSLVSASGPENLKNYIQLALNGREAENTYPFVVYDKINECYVGSTRFYDFQEKHHTTQLGFTWYGKEFQGTGINKQCKFLLLSFAFETLGLERVEFRADNNNEVSKAAMKSIGCTVEGVLRNNCASPTGRRDSIVLSILKEEWFSDVKARLRNKINFQKSVAK